jgi:hypothetical protein
MHDKSYFLRDGIMNNHDRRNLNIRSIMELKIHMRDRITTGRRERQPVTSVAELKMMNFICWSDWTG